MFSITNARMSKNGIDSIANSCRNIISTELKKQFAGNFPSDSQLLLTDIYAKRNRNLEPIKPDPAFEGFFRGTNKATDFEPGKLLQRPLPFWNVLENERIASAKLSLGPRNHWEEQIQWTKQGRMWPYPIDNEYLIGEEAQTSFVDHVFLEPVLAKYKLPPSKAISHFMELILVGLSKNPYMSVQKKREHIRWYAEYFRSAYAEKYRELLK